MGANLLLDTSSKSRLGVPFIVHSAPTLDLTDVVARELKIPLATVTLMQ